MSRSYTLHDTQNDLYTKRCLTLAECGAILLTHARWKWLIVYDRAASKPRLCEDGVVRRWYCLQVIPVHGSKTTVARCEAVNYNDATKLLLERAAKFKYDGTPADRYTVRERAKL